MLRAPADWLPPTPNHSPQGAGGARAGSDAISLEQIGHEMIGSTFCRNEITGTGALPDHQIILFNMDRSWIDVGRSDRQRR